MTALDLITLAVASLALGLATGCALQLRRHMRDRVDIWVHHQSLPGHPTPAPTPATIRACKE